MSHPSPFESDRAAWRSRVERELKGRDPDRTLLSWTEDGLTLRPLYLADDADAPPPEAAGSRGVGPLPWGVDASYAWPAAGPEIAVDVEGGVTGLRIDPAACGLSSPADLAALLPRDDLQVELVGAGCAHWLPSLPARGSLLCRPGEVGVGALLADGVSVTLSSEAWASAGATGLQEVGWLIASALLALREADEAGASPAEAGARLGLTVTVRREIFPSIARLRALRLLWARALAAWRVTPPPLRIRAVTHAGTLTARDPWLNLLRGSHGAFAAIAGGADRIEVLPFDAALGRPDGLARRMARNTPQILGLESHLGRVRDPAAGSWFLESLTAQSAQGAWAEFQRVGGDRGLRAAIESGRVDDLCEGSWDARTDALGNRRAAITGVSEYPDPAPLLERPGPARPVRHRDSEDWERLRARVEAAGARVFLATWGPRAEWNARAMWAENLLRAAGFDVVVHGGGDVEELPAAWADAGAQAACLCAVDARYIEAGAVAERLREAGATVLLLAGRSSHDTEAADLDLLLHAGAPVLERLTALAATVLDPSP